MEENQIPIANSKKEGAQKTPDISSPIKETGAVSDMQTRNLPENEHFEKIREKVREEAKEVKSKKEDDAPKSNIPPLRTYKDDVARTIRKQQESYVSVLAAESKKRSGKMPAETAGTNKSAFVLALSIILFIGGASAVGLIYFLSKEEVPAPLSIPHHVFVEEQKEIDVTGKDRNALMRTLVGEVGEVNLTLGSLSQLYLIETLLEKKKLIDPKTLLSRLEVRAPQYLLRTLNSMTFGVHTVKGNQPFLIIDVNAFESAFAGMLEWEKDVHEDLAPLFGSPTEVSGGSIILSVNTSFVDKVIKNKDTRILKNDIGEIVLLYSFLDKKTLVVATNEQTLNEIVNRFSSSQF